MRYSHQSSNFCRNLTIAISMIAISLILLIVAIVTVVNIDYKYEQKFSYAWQLADKSSTIIAKSNYITEFISNIEENRNMFADYNAIFYKTQDNSINKNLEALKTLQQRLEEIKKMDPNSFQYNTAIEQITKQEQGEANDILSVFYGCYYLQQYPFYWDWIGVTWAIFLILVLICSLIWWVIIVAD